MKHNLQRVSNAFSIPGTFISGEPYGSGHINDTYAVVFEEDGRSVRYLFQRINHTIFQDVPSLMENIARVTRHIRGKLEQSGVADIDRRTLTLILTRTGNDFLEDVDGLYWRAYIFIEGARTYDIIENEGQAFAAAKSFGQFQVQLSDLPPPRLQETIPEFHNTRSRFNTLLKAIEEDSVNRAKEAKAEIAFALGHEAIVDVLINLQASGEIPERITHNDTKLNNVMIDNVTSEGISVIDLDTVMPGLALYDFGDMVRTATNTGAEDEKDLSKVRMDLSMFKALAKGYLAGTENSLTPREIELLPFSGKLICFQIGIRFLIDFLSGDSYFKVHREGHNLDRCRTQFTMVRSIEQQEEEMKQVVEAICVS